MTDLFTRLAQRAVGDAPAATRAEPELDPALGSGDGDHDQPAAVPGAPHEGAVTPGPPAAGGDVAAVAEPEAPAPAASPLVPMPSVVPPPGDDADRSRAATPPDAPVRAEREPARTRANPADLAIADTSRAAAPPAPTARVRAGALVAPAPAPAAPPRRDPPAPPVAGPSIEVTIGRVEVRVRPPAAPSRDRVDRRNAPAPALPLDEYLRRREASS